MEALVRARFVHDGLARTAGDHEGVGLDIAQQAMRLAAHKIPMKTKFIAREKTE